MSEQKKKRRGVTGSVQISPGVPIERQRVRAQAAAVNNLSGRGKDSRLGPNPQVRNGVQRDANAMIARNDTIDAKSPQPRVMVRPPEPRFGGEQPYREVSEPVQPPVPRAEMNQAVMKRRVAEISKMSPAEAQAELDRRNGGGGDAPGTFAGSDREINSYQQGVMDKLGGYFDTAKEFGGDMVRQVPFMGDFGIDKTGGTAVGGNAAVDPYNTGYDNNDVYNTKTPVTNKPQSILDPENPDFVGPPDPGKRGVGELPDPYGTGYDNKNPYGNGKDYLAEGETANTREESMRILRKQGLQKLEGRDTTLGRRVTGMSDSRGGSFTNNRQLSHIDRNFDRLNKSIRANSSPNSAAAARIISDNEDNRFDQKTRVQNTGAFRERTASDERAANNRTASNNFQSALAAEAEGRKLTQEQRTTALNDMYTSYDDDGNKIVDYKGLSRQRALFPDASLNEAYAAQPISDVIGEIEEVTGRRINDMSEAFGSGRTETRRRPDGSTETVYIEGASKTDNLDFTQMWNSRHTVGMGNVMGEMMDFLPFVETDWITLANGESFEASQIKGSMSALSRKNLIGGMNDDRRVTTRQMDRIEDKRR